MKRPDLFNGGVLPGVIKFFIHADRATTGLTDAQRNELEEAVEKVLNEKIKKPHESNHVWVRMTSQ